jgi:small-conductance mechanosensitive channel
MLMIITARRELFFWSIVEISQYPSIQDDGSKRELQTKLLSLETELQSTIKAHQAAKEQLEQNTAQSRQSTERIAALEGDLLEWKAQCDASEAARAQQQDAHSAALLAERERYAALESGLKDRIAAAVKAESEKHASAMQSLRDEHTSLLKQTNEKLLTQKSAIAVCERSFLPIRAICS